MVASIRCGALESAGVFGISIGSAEGVANEGWTRGFDWSDLLGRTSGACRVVLRIALEVAVVASRPADAFTESNTESSTEGWSNTTNWV